MCLSVYVYMSVFMCAAYSECLSRLWLRELYRAIRSAMSHQLAANVFYAEVEGGGRGRGGVSGALGFVSARRLLRAAKPVW